MVNFNGFDKGVIGKPLPILRNQGKCKDQNGVRSITTY